MRRACGRTALVVASAAAASGIALGCVLQLEHRLACGDGYVDLRAGEECDPADRDSFAGACAEAGFPRGIADCHPTECRIIADVEQCERCGDGILQRGNAVEVELDTESDSGGDDTDGPLREQCDRDDFAEGAECPEGGVLKCDASCQLDLGDCNPFCGDGELLGDEECGEAGPDSFAAEKTCAPDDHGGTGVSSPSGFVYGSGMAQCVDCKWTREHCSYCGNGRRDDALIIDLATGLESQDEWCDGDDLDLGRLVAKYGDSCARENENWQPNARCSGCFDFAMENDAVPCCVRNGAFCPLPSDPVQCCYAAEHPEDPEPCRSAMPLPPICKGPD
ncbi:MAG TPA: hypothetical protein VFG69_14120 [Nannocystaceae bacterium]|nr:hypothetical protein [Nannocystaceae bacterium]